MIFDTWVDVNGQTLSGVSQGDWTRMMDTNVLYTWGICWWNICGNAVVVRFWPQINFVWLIIFCSITNGDTLVKSKIHRAILAMFGIWIQLCTIKVLGWIKTQMIIGTCTYNGHFWPFLLPVLWIWLGFNEEQKS